MVVENKEKKSKAWIIVAIIIILIIVFVVYFLGTKGILKILGTFITILWVLAILFGGAYLFYHLFIKKHRFDITYVNKQRLIEAGKLNIKGYNVGDLYLSGDAGHSRVCLGKIKGYCRVQILTRTSVYEDKTDKEGKVVKVEKKVLDKETNTYVPVYDSGKEEQDVFSVAKRGIMSFFTDPYVIRVSPEEHDDIVGDVTLKGFSLLPHSEFWFLNSDYLDVRKIDYAILKEAERGIMFETLRDMKSIVDKATGVDSEHKKFIEKKNLVEVPEANK